ncbi:MAG: cupin domain-containing protein [Xanthobacteraceae bacterium]
MLPGVSLKILRQTDGPVPGYVTTVVEIEIEGGTAVVRHTHPGIESTYVIEGGGELNVEGQPSRILRPGDAFQVPPGVVHSVQIGDRKTKVCSTLVVEKGKPLVSPA